jgi:hypothetical protein
MKKLALILFVTLGLAGVARAQQDPELLTMPLTAPCYLTKDAEQLLKKEHGEIAFAQGESVIWNSKIEDYINVTTKIYVNPETFSFTVAYDVVEDGVTCVVTTGNNFRPHGSRTKI